MTDSPIYKRELAPMSPDEMDALQGLLRVSNNRTSPRQKKALRHLLVQYQILLHGKREQELSQMIESGVE